jgi:hypothetical protein
MSLSAREQQALESIKEGLARSDPRLVAMLATFTRLVSGEQMPVRERIRAGSRRAAGRRRHPRSKSRRHTGFMHQRAGFQRAMLLVYVLLTAALVVTGVVLSRSGGHIECPSVLAVPCASPTPARSSHPAVHKGTAHEVPASQAPGQQVRVRYQGDWGARG